MVRLRACCRGRQYMPVTFQFQYGTIKGITTSAPVQLGLSFQFQYGTIKGFDVGGSLSFVVLFQFQYGTIKGNLHG